MSHSHIRKAKEVPPPSPWWRIALFPAVMAVLCAALFIFANWVTTLPKTYERAQGKILEVRRHVDSIHESSYGTKVVYGLEAHVQYTMNGQMQDRWLSASDDLPKEILALKLAAHPTECMVYWPPKHPESAKCSLQ